MAKKEPTTIKMYGMSIGKWMTGLSAFPFGVIFHSRVALLSVHLTASTTADTTQSQRANWKRITSQLKILAFAGLRSPCFAIPWIDPTIRQRLAQNELWLTGASAVVGIIEWFFKPLRWAITKLWSLLRRSFKRPRITLRFVAMDYPPHWGTGRWNDKPFMAIVTQWWITNAPGSGQQRGHFLRR